MELLGHKLVEVLSESFETWATTRGTFATLPSPEKLLPGRIIENVEVTDTASVRKALEAVKPDVVINAVGVIKQLPSSKDVTTSLLVNSIFPQRLASLSAEFGYRLFTVSTDCVFDGSKGFYSEADVPDAKDLYGQSKRWGEIVEGNCLTLRTSIIGHELGTAHSLVDWFLSNRDGKVNGFTRAIYSGFPTLVFAHIIRDLIIKHPELNGLYNVSSEPINKFDLLNLIEREYKANVTITPCEELEIDRSLDSTKFRSETGFQPLSWPEMVRLMHADNLENY